MQSFCGDGWRCSKIAKVLEPAPHKTDIRSSATTPQEVQNLVGAVCSRHSDFLACQRRHSEQCGKRFFVCAPLLTLTVVFNTIVEKKALNPRAARLTDFRVHLFREKLKMPRRYMGVATGAPAWEHEQFGECVFGFSLRVWRDRARQLLHKGMLCSPSRFMRNHEPESGDPSYFGVRLLCSVSAYRELFQESVRKHFFGYFRTAKSRKTLASFALRC